MWPPLRKEPCTLVALMDCPGFKNRCANDIPCASEPLLPLQIHSVPRQRIKRMNITDKTFKSLDDFF